VGRPERKEKKEDSESGGRFRKKKIFCKVAAEEILGTIMGETAA